MRPPTSSGSCSWSYQRTVRVGSGEAHWAFVSTELLRWGVKTRSGFSIEGDPQITADRRYRLVAHLGPLRINEPVRVVSVADEPHQVGFIYATLPGHPVRGKEEFAAERRADDSIWLTVRSVTRPAHGVWRLAYPAALLAQRFYRRRYFSALLVEG